MAGEQGPQKIGGISPERYFLMYAYPCIRNLQHEHKLSKEDAKNLERILFENKAIKREYLESCFPSAFKRIKIVAEQMNRDYWDMDVLRKYWLEEHNRFIDAGDGDYARALASFKELCKVHKAEVIDKKDNILSVKYDGIIRKVFATLVPDVKKGDKVMIHLAFAIEKVD